MRRHTFRNAVLPIVAMVGMDVGLAFAGSLFVERAFRIPGIGMLTISSLQRRDLPVILGIVVVVSLVVVVCNLIAELVLGVLDPRVGGRMFRLPRRTAFACVVCAGRRARRDGSAHLVVAPVDSCVHAARTLPVYVHWKGRAVWL